MSAGHPGETRKAECSLASVAFEKDEQKNLSSVSRVVILIANFSFQRWLGGAIDIGR